MFFCIRVVPFVGAYLLHENRGKIFPDGNGLYPAAAAPIVLTILFCAFGNGQAGRLAELDHLAVMTLSFVPCIDGGLGLFYGIEALRP